MDRISAPIGDFADKKSAEAIAVEPTLTPTVEISTPSAQVLVADTVSVNEDQLLASSTPQPIPPKVEPDAIVADKPKRGRPKGIRNAPKNGEYDSPSHVPNIGDIKIAAEAVVVDYKLMADATFDLTTGVLSSALGPEWQPKDADEKQMVCVPLARYFEYKQVKDLPPNLALALVVTAYAAPRFREPSTASKMRMFWAWTKEQIKRVRGK